MDYTSTIYRARSSSFTTKEEPYPITPRRQGDYPSIENCLSWERTPNPMRALCVPTFDENTHTLCGCARDEFSFDGQTIKIEDADLTKLKELFQRLMAIANADIV